MATLLTRNENLAFPATSIEQNPVGATVVDISSRYLLYAHRGIRLQSIGAVVFGAHGQSVG